MIRLHPLLLPLLLPLGAAALPDVLPGQVTDGTRGETDGAAVEQVKAWPKATDQDRARIGALVGQFKKADDDLTAKAVADLVDLGTLVVPMLFQKVSDREAVDNTPIFAVFDRLLGPQHAGLMAEESLRKRQRVALRRYLIGRLCMFHDAATTAALKASTGDADDETRFFAWLGLLSLGDTDAIAPVIERCKQDWDEVGPLVAQSLPAARSDALGTAIAEHIARARTTDQAAGLRLMRYAATKQQTLIVRNYLGAEDHGVKKAAVNAMRALNGMEPIEKLAVFQVIEMAKEWQTK